MKVSERYNYVAFFLTLSCNLRCKYCINLHGHARRLALTATHMRGEQWVKAVDRLSLRDDLPLTLQGGEPTLHKDFYWIVNEAKPEIKMDLLTNLSFDVDEFIANVPRWRFLRNAPYAPIRVSYHPGQNSIDELKKKARCLMDAGFRVGIYGIEHPDQGKRDHIFKVRDECLQAGIDFRTKEFLGDWQGTLHGTFRYEGAIAGPRRDCECRGSELLVGPDGSVFRCHADLYHTRSSIGHILDESFSIAELEVFRSCSFFGECNPCDVKVKTNRFQQFGHTSCEIRL